MAFGVDFEEAVEAHSLTGGGEAGVGVSFGEDLHIGFFDFGVGHLRSYGALPDEGVESLLLSCAVDVVMRYVGGADGLVGFLRPF